MDQTSAVSQLYREADGLSLSVHAGTGPVQSLPVVETSRTYIPHTSGGNFLEKNEMKVEILDLMCLEGFLKILIFL